jgi:hypothetical protein
MITISQISEQELELFISESAEPLASLPDPVAVLQANEPTLSPLKFWVLVPHTYQIENEKVRHWTLKWFPRKWCTDAEASMMLMEILYSNHWWEFNNSSTEIEATTTQEAYDAGCRSFVVSTDGRLKRGWAEATALAWGWTK